MLSIGQYIYKTAVGFWGCRGHRSFHHDTELYTLRGVINIIPLNIPVYLSDSIEFMLRVYNKLLLPVVCLNIVLQWIVNC